jgi:hypothetical protein
MDKQTVVINEPILKLMDELEGAYGCCVEARKIAALTKHGSFNKIGQVIDLIEEIFEEYEQQ